ncbi:MAG: hypothetical protein KAH48_07550, partial [Chlorobi bacterium]|nr:hypothetical protein [Chlorobiota bacterium]
MKFAINVLALLLFSLSITQAESYNIEYIDDGIVVKISKPETAHRSSTSSSKFLFELMWNSGKFRAINSNNPTPLLSAKIAAPISGIKTINLNLTKKRYLGYEYSDKHIGTMQPYIELGETLKQRDRNISQILINPFGIDPQGSLYVADEFEIIITFFENVEQSDPDNIIPAIRDVLNDRHLNFLKQTTLTKKKSAKLLQSDWYSSEKEYVKIETTKDGIAIINADEIIAANNIFSGINNADLTLIYKGEEIPCKIINDSDGLLNSGDEIVFLGSRATGEETYHSVYTGTEAFWLTYDESTNGLRYADFPSGNSEYMITDITVKHHFEEDNLYAVGDGFFYNLSREVKGEGWYMYEINDSDRQVFDYNFILSPRNSSEVNLLLAVKANSVVLSTKYTPENQLLSAAINNDFASDHSIPVREGTKFDIDINSLNLLGGSNNLKLVNRSAEFVGKYAIDVDYLETTSEEAPLAYQSGFIGETAMLDKDRAIYIGGFSDENIILIDKNNSYINNAVGETGTTVRLGASPSSLVSLMINDSPYVDSLHYGIYTAMSQAPNYDNPEIKYFDDFDAATSYLKSCPDKSQIALAANSDISSNSELITYLISLGSTLAPDLSDGDMYVMTTIKGSSDVIEDMNSDGAAVLSVFLPHTGGQSYAIKTGLKTAEQYSFRANDNSTTERAVVSADNKSNLMTDKTQATAIYIYHPLFKESTQKLVDHRRSTLDMNIKMISVNDIYKE